jgi:hypothetical protein
MQRGAQLANVAARLNNLEQKYDENTDSEIADKLERLYAITVGGASIHGAEDSEAQSEIISEDPTVFDPGGLGMSLYMVLFGQRAGGGQNYGIKWLKQQISTNYSFGMFTACFGDTTDTSDYDRWATDNLAAAIVRLEDRMDIVEAAILSLDGRMTALESQVSALPPRLDALEPLVAGLSDNVDTLNTQVSGHTTALSDQAADIADIKARLAAAGL